MKRADGNALRMKVQEGYGRIARQGGSCCGPAKSCCGSSNADARAENIGYDEAELSVLPEGANMGLSCGNPTAIASLEPGEVVLDIGSGGGFDVFIAGKKVGASGRAIGVDMTPDMLTRARGNITAYERKTGLNNVEFRLGEIEHLPVPDNSVDVIISNCVINLSPDKPRVWREMFRVLKHGGRVAASDMALLRPLPEVIGWRVEALIGCVAGAVLLEETRQMACAVGFRDVVLTPQPSHVDAMFGEQDPSYREFVRHLPKGTTLSDFITSVDVEARKAWCCSGTRG
jgi:SAM-dependent methyltransferase